MEFVVFRFWRMDKMDSVMNGLMGQCLQLRIFGLEPFLVFLLIFHHLAATDKLLTRYEKFWLVLRVC